ncbi:MAG: TetR/AcrR family transcriptional regulator [Clostridia bacterium]|nr:TetR/AcrR family transcriptional regulator [Clostridia bacterium]
MPPKIKVTKEEILNTAVELVKKSGAQSLNARSIASALNCSTQPIFSNFDTMEALRSAVVGRAEEMFREYMRLETERGEFPPYKAVGMAYIRFAREEKELFRLLYMRDRSEEPDSEESDLDDRMESIVRHVTGLSPDKAKLFHLETWAFVHGVAVMFATGLLDLDLNLVSRMITDCYRGLRKQYGLE